MPSHFPQKIPNALAALACNQVEKIDCFTEHRRKIASFYNEKLENTSYKLPQEKQSLKHSYLRFTIETNNAPELILKAQKRSILLGDWYCKAFMPVDADLDKIGYQKSFCPNAESLNHRMLNLPTHINIDRKKAQKIVDFLKTHKK